MANRLKLKEGISADELLKYGFVNRGHGRFDRCLVGYLNYLVYDCKTREFSQLVSTPDFMGDTEEKQGRPILKILTNKDEWYVKGRIIFPEGIEQIVELVTFTE